jgi:hypothetical protein
MSAPEIITFGCRLNTFESEVMRGHARGAGLDDVVVVHTCAVTAEAERQARQAIRRARRERPGARIVVTGCAAQIDPAAFAAMPEVDRVVGNDDKLRPETWRRLFGPDGLPAPAEYNVRARARQRLFEALQAVHLRGETHITVRELRATLVYILFGVNFCDDYHAAPNETPLPYWDRAFRADSPARQGEVLRELARFDPALEAHPQIDRHLLSRPIADGSKSAPHYPKLPLESARRRAFFEWTTGDIEQVARDPHALDLARGRHLRLFRELPLADEQKLAEVRGDAARGFVFDAGNLTVGEWADRWLRDAVADTVRPVTYAKYEQIVRNHIKPSLGRLKLTALNPAHVRGLYREKLDGGLSPRTVQYVHVTLNKALKQAVADGLVPRNVCEAVKPPRPQKREISPLSPEQARRFLEACRGERLEALFVLAIHTGMRQGGLLGLHWEDVDLGGWGASGA